MNENVVADIRRELEKIGETLKYADDHFYRLSQSNAALHLSDRVIPTPLSSAVHEALSSIIHISNRLNDLES